MAAAALGMGSAGQGRAAVLLDSGFESLTGSDPVHFAGGSLLDGHLSATANPDAVPGVYLTSDPAPGWVVDTQAGGTMNPTAAYMPGEALGGELVGWSSGALLYRTLADVIEPLTRYTFTVNIGRPTVSTGDFAYRIIMESGGLVRVEDVNSQAIGVGEWGTATVTWDSPAVVPAGARLTINLAADAGVALFDEIEVSAGPSIPEPAMMGLALLPLMMGMRRRGR